MRIDQDKEQSPSKPVSPSKLETGVAARRRLLLSGAKAAPIVVATLASRSSLACHCVMPSAWGSLNVAIGGGDMDMGDKINLAAGSVQARWGGKIKEMTSPFYFSAFNGDGPWSALCSKVNFPQGLTTGLNTNSARRARKIAYLKGNYSFNGSPLTVQGLCGLIGYAVPNGSGSGYPLQTIQGGGFAGAILVAEINMCLNRIPTVECLDKDKLNSMATNAYYLPTGVAAADAWTATNGQIADYLHNNWMARRA